MSLYARMDVDTWTLLSMLWAIRDGRSKCFLDFDVGRATGYLNCLSNHDLISFDQRQRLGSAATTSPSRPASTSMYDWADTEPVTPIAGCISSKTKCQCFNESGSALKLSHAQCLSAIINPLPRSIIVGTGGGSGNGNAGSGVVPGTSPQPTAGQQPANVL